MRFVACCFSVLCLTLAPLRAEDSLAKKIEAIIHGPDYKQAHWGLLVVDAKSGDTVYALNPDMMFSPASVTKLYSCAAALVALGAESRVSTPVYIRGTRDGKKIKGDLVLVAKGDLTFGGRTDENKKVVYKDNDHTYANGSEAELTDTDPLAGLKSLASQIKEAGVEEIEGDILIDDRLFEPARGTGSGPSAISPIVVNDNLIDVIITPGAKPGSPAMVKFRPETAYIHADADVLTGAKDSKANFQVPGEEPQNLVIRGSIPMGSKPLLKIVPVNRPAEFARTLFIEALRKQGIRVSAALLRNPGEQVSLPDRAEYARFDTIAAFMSPQLKDSIKVTLKVSHNLYASTLPCLIASRKGGRTLARGLQEQGKILKELGVDVNTISFGGGAGGSSADKVTPRATVQLLQAMRKRPEWEAYREGFPVLGVDGTLATIVGPDSPAKGKVFAKTGTMYWSDFMNDRTLLTSKALAGVMTTKQGKELFFAMFVNDVPLPKGVPTSREGKVLGKLAELIQQNAP